ncbi:hypothetical protein LIER_12698 [Lithospermum erythrorhizon]|uniref:Uncharacterized protein n=1 Tax=Lithospermum erythrorhizon TaxID=34254 RepID=A0AAV3PV75_LITER
MSVADYFGKLQPLWDELATYNPVSVCNCGGYSIGLGEQFQRQVNEERLHNFLLGINDELFGHLHSSLLAQDPPPLLDHAYQTILQEEQVLSNTKTRTDKDDIMAMDGGGGSAARSQQAVTAPRQAGRGAGSTMAAGILGPGGRSAEIRVVMTDGSAMTGGLQPTSSSGEVPVSGMNFTQ